MRPVAGGQGTSKQCPLVSIQYSPSQAPCMETLLWIVFGIATVMVTGAEHPLSMFYSFYLIFTKFILQLPFKETYIGIVFKGSILSRSLGLKWKNGVGTVFIRSAPNLMCKHLFWQITRFSLKVKVTGAVNEELVSTE